MARKISLYTGNWPNSSNYDSRIPVGPNKWDESEFYDGNDMRDDEWDDEAPEEETDTPKDIEEKD